MKSHLTTLLIALIVGYLGGISSQFFQSKSTPDDQTQVKPNTDLSKPSHTQTEPSDLSMQIAQLQQRIDWLETQVFEATQNQTDKSEDKPKGSVVKSTRRSRPATPNKDNLVSAGVDRDIADDILRRISQQEYQRLELQNLIRRNASSDTRKQYTDQLRELNKNRISIRSELGDDDYDQYLFVSGKNNRVKVSSVMADSPAELNGIQKDDVILYYDDQKVLTRVDLRDATLEGDIGSFTYLEILRSGTRMSLMVPRGTLGIRMEATQLDPAQ